MEEDQKVIEARPAGSRLETILFYGILLLAFLLPIFFLPKLSLSVGKSVLLYGGILVLLVLWIIQKLKDGTAVIPKSKLTLAILAVPIAFILSSIFSGEFTRTFFGMGIEVGTAASVTLATALLFLVAAHLQNKQRIFTFYVAFFASFAIVALFQLIRLLGGVDILDFGTFTLDTANMIGKWNELGIFFGLSAIISLITIESLVLNTLSRWLVIAVLAISLFFLGIINFKVVLIVIAGFALLSTIYRFATSRKPREDGTIAPAKFSIPSLVVLIVTLVFIFFGSSILQSGHFPDKLKPSLSQVEVFVPTWGHTFEIAKHALKEDPIFGSGPNTFSREWLAHKPPEINPSIFWNIDFSYGRGLIPTFITTTGILGVLAFIALFALFLYKGFHAMFSPVKDSFSRYVLMSSFFAALYLWIFQIIYVPGELIFSLGFLFTGAFLAALMLEKQIESQQIIYAKNPKTNFVAVLLLIVALIAAVSFIFMIGKKLASAVYFQNSSRVLSEKGDVLAAQNLIKKAVAQDPKDQYYRTLAEIDILKINAVINQQNVKTETLQAQVLQILPDLLDETDRAVKLNPNNYQNWVMSGRVYETLMPLGYTDAYNRAIASYNKALELNPRNPLIYLFLARTEAVNKNNLKAKEYITKAVELKPNYTEAVYLWSQIEIGEGNIKGAIDAVAQAAALSPRDPVVFFQLGYLRYANKDYSGSIAALEQAVVLNSQFSNARYFLGLDYAKLGRFSDATAQFLEIQKYNPENEEVKSILANLRAGKDPFATASSAKTPTSKTAPKKLPVKDDASDNNI